MGILIFNQLKLEHSLYNITPEVLERFIKLSEIYLIDGYVSTAKSASKLDSHAIVLHIWCLLNEDTYQILFNPEKMLIYSIDYYILNLLRKNKYIKCFMESKESNEDFKFILAYYLACGTLQWGDHVITKSIDGQQLCELNSSREYFSMSSKVDLSTKNNEDFYLFQKKIIHLMAIDYTANNQFEEQISQAIYLARLYHNQHLFT